MNTKLALSALIGAMGIFANAQNLVANGNFESGTGAIGANSWATFTSGSPLSGWGVLPVGNVVVVGAGSTFTWLTPSPSKELDLSGTGPDSVGSGVFQDLATSIGQMYTLTTDVYCPSGSIEIKAGNNTWTRTNVGSRSTGETFSFVADSATTTLQFKSTSGIWTHIDNVSVVAAVPEPATMAVLGLGVFGLIRRKRSK
jgi:hypothetical protein